MLVESTEEARRHDSDFPQPVRLENGLWNPEFKAWVVNESDKPGVELARLAQRVGNNVTVANIHTWRHERNKKDPSKATSKRARKKGTARVLGTTVYRTGVEDLTKKILMIDESIASCYEMIESLKADRDILKEQVVTTLVERAKV